MHGASKDGVAREFIIYPFTVNGDFQCRSCHFQSATLLIGACRLRVGTLGGNEWAPEPLDPAQSRS